MAANEYNPALEDLGPEPDLGAAPGDDQNPYAELLREQHQGQATALRVTARAAAATPPDQAAQVLRLANHLQVPPSIVARNLPWFDRQDRLQATPYEQILRETPTLGAWLQQPEHAAVAQDNLPVLRRLEGVLRGHAQAEAAGPAGAESLNPDTGTWQPRSPLSSANPVASLVGGYEVSYTEGAQTFLRGLSNLPAILPGLILKDGALSREDRPILSTRPPRTRSRARSSWASRRWWAWRSRRP